MIRITTYLWIGCLLLLASACQANRPAPPTPATISVDTLRADFATLYQRLQSAHADLFVHRDRADYDARFHDMLGGLSKPMTPFDAQVYFQKFVAYGNVAHASIAFPDDAFDAFRDRGGRTLPIYLRIVDGRAYVGENYSGHQGLRTGDEILALDELPMARWLERAAAHVSADTPYIAHSLLEFTFPRYVWVELGEVERFALRIRNLDGKTLDVNVNASTREEQRAIASEQATHFTLQSNERIARVLEDNIAYLRPGPFYHFEDPNNIWSNAAFVTFIDEAFGQFIKAQAGQLIIDLRQNPGGDNSFSDPMLAWIASGPFRFCSSFTIRSSDEAAASNQERLDNNPAAVAGVSGQFAQQYAKVPRGENFEFDIPLVTPREDQRFTGDVYVLVDRHSYSNSVNVAAIVQDYKLGLIAGEKTADMATTYGAMETFTLAGTGMKVGFPKAHIVRPSGERRSDGVTPDLPIESPIVPTDGDTMLDLLIEKILARR
ncbi:MAG: S41 family peptidase [Gammaproteobacteria bacterium]